MKNLDQLINQCLRQDRKGQQKLYEYTYVSLAASLSFYASDDNDRDWIFNAGMLKLYENLKHFQKGTNYLAWARTILVRNAIDHYRSRSKQRQETSIENVGPIYDQADLAILDSLSIEEIIAMVQKLPENQRLVFTMHVVEGYSHKEISQQTDININTSKWLLAQAKRFISTYFSAFNKSINHG